MDEQRIKEIEERIRQARHFYACPERDCHREDHSRDVDLDKRGVALAVIDDANRLLAEVARLEQERDKALADIALARQVRDDARAELAKANAEIERLKAPVRHGEALVACVAQSLSDALGGHVHTDQALKAARAILSELASMPCELPSAKEIAACWHETPYTTTIEHAEHDGQRVRDWLRSRLAPLLVARKVTARESPLQELTAYRPSEGKLAKFLGHELDQYGQDGRMLARAVIQELEECADDYGQRLGLTASAAQTPDASKSGAGTKETIKRPSIWDEFREFAWPGVGNPPNRSATTADLAAIVALIQERIDGRGC